MKGLTIHVALLAVASAAALKIWTRDAEQDKAATAEVSVWSATPESVEAVTLHTEGVVGTSDTPSPEVAVALSAMGAGL